MNKIDFMKAFECVDWEFIMNLLSACFGPKWCGWIRMILFSAKCNIPVNDHRFKTTQCKRGLQQGDPLLPMLLVLAMMSLICAF